MPVKAVCKVEGCERPEKASRGRYAHLCTTHIDELRQSNGAADEEQPVRLDDAARLQGAADEVADATYAYRAAKSRLEDAIAEVDKILGRIRAPV